MYKKGNRKKEFSKVIVFQSLKQTTFYLAPMHKRILQTEEKKYSILSRSCCRNYTHCSGVPDTLSLTHNTQHQHNNIISTHQRSSYMHTRCMCA